jgi:hypothetical protein
MRCRPNSRSRNGRGRHHDPYLTFTAHMLATDPLKAAL